MTGIRSGRDPYSISVAVLVALAAAGLVSVGVAWRGLAASLVVATQLPYAVSGAMGGLALLGFALGLLGVQAARRAEARERAQIRRFTVAAAAVLAVLREGEGK